MSNINFICWSYTEIENEGQKEAENDQLCFNQQRISGSLYNKKPISVDNYMTSVALEEELHSFTCCYGHHIDF